MKKLFFIIVFAILIYPISLKAQSIGEALDIGLVPEHLQSHPHRSITRGEFASIIVRLYEIVTDEEIYERKEFFDTTDINIQKIGGLGLTVDLGGFFFPDIIITREQAAIIIARLVDILGLELPKVNPAFDDYANISHAALESVGQVTKIMGSSRDNIFGPQHVLTREQSIIIALRLFNILNGITINNNQFQYRHHVNIPVFMYHTSSEHNPGPLEQLYVRPSEFERQIRHLVENGYTFVTFDDWHNLHNIYRPVMITFDDGYLANYTEIFPILQEYNARITIFLTTNNINTFGLKSQMVVEMSDSGLVKFEAHSITHRNFTTLDDNNLTTELRDARDIIEELTGRPVLAVAWPVGGWNSKVAEFASRYYSFGLNTRHAVHNTGSNDFEISRLRVNRNTSLSSFVSMLN